jgi:hypothetical protein
MPEPARPDFADCIFGRGVLGLGDFVHAIQHEPRTRGLIRLATVVAVLSCSVGLWLMNGPRAVAGLALVAFGLVCFATHQAPDHIAQRWFEKTPPAARSVRYTITPRELIVASDVAQQAYAWRSIVGYHEAPEALLIWVSVQLFLIVPKRAFSAEDLTRLLTELERQELGGPPELPRFWSWLLLAAALGGLGLILWNRLSPR